MSQISSAVGNKTPSDTRRKTDHSVFQSSYTELFMTTLHSSPTYKNYIVDFTMPSFTIKAGKDRKQVVSLTEPPTKLILIIINEGGFSAHPSRRAACKVVGFVRSFIAMFPSRPICTKANVVIESL
jgi:hypothetical protein